MYTNSNMCIQEKEEINLCRIVLALIINIMQASGTMDGFGYNPHMINNGVRKPPMTF